MIHSAGHRQARRAAFQAAGTGSTLTAAFASAPPAGIEIAGLRACPLLSEAHESTLLALARESRVRAFPAGATIHRAGQRPGFVQCLSAGTVEFWSRIGAARTIVATLQAPALLATANALLGSRAAMSIVTRTPCETVAIAAAAFRRALRCDPGLCHAVLLHACRVNRLITDRLLEQKLSPPDRRLAHWLLAEMRRRGGATRFDLAVPKQALASELGVSPANLSRLLGALPNHGVVNAGRAIIVTDLARLERFAQG